jgi:hypothetical protein
LEFVLEQGQVGPFAEYMERWSRAVPSTGWPSEVGVWLHLSNVAISLLILALPWRRELLCLLAVTFLLSQLASPERIASHSTLMAGGLLVILLLGSAEWLEGPARRGRSAARRTDWYGWTLTGLAWICALTYFFAFFYKLNDYWLPRSGVALNFLIRPVEPIADGLGLLPSFQSALAPVATYGTLLAESLLPPLLFWRRTRLLGCLVGLVFHLPMVAQGVVDFPSLIVAFYPAFLSLGETREVLRRGLARPGIARLAGTLALGGFWIWAFQRSPKLDAMYGSEPGLDPLAAVAFNGLTCATLLGFSYLTLTLGAWLLERRSPAIPEPTDAAGGTPPRTAPPDLPGHRRASPGSALAAASVLFVSAAFVYNNLALFFGLPFAGAMLMYSGIDPAADDHLVLPRVSLGDWMAHASIVRFEPRGIKTREAREFREFTEWLDEQDRPPQLHLNHLRYHMHRVCASAPGATLQLEIELRGDTLAYENVCAEPTMLSYLVIPTESECRPSCGSALRRWAGHPLPTD